MTGQAFLASAPGPSAPSRRTLLKTLTGLSIGTAVFHRALAAAAAKTAAVSAEMIQQAEWIAGITLDDKDRRALISSLEGALRKFRAMRAVPLANSVAPALVFRPAASPVPASDPKKSTVTPSVGAAPQRPDSDDGLSFLSVTELGALLRTRRVSALELTKLYLKRLRKHDPVLHCVVTYTEELALKQAAHADREIAAGHYRGPLHGIPWGAKDLIAYPGYKTTWGAAPFKDQVIDVKAAVAQRLEEAGAVLVAKLTLGALAMGDRWFGGMTRNPWDPKRGSSGSSAGSAAASAAGLVGFALGSETLGSIVSPCRVCGATGLRPTFGRVSRHGCMTLCWSMDKIGPIARSVEDCALIFGAIHGADVRDAASVDRPFSWPSPRKVDSLRIGYFDEGKPVKSRDDLRVLRDLGVKLVPLKLPSQLPAEALIIILNTEAATVFDELTRKGVTEGLNDWTRIFRQGQFVPAIEYLRANRIRTLLMSQMEEMMAKVDAYVGGDDLVVTNLTGHPTVVMPNGFQKTGTVESPSAITFTGKLYGEAELLAVAHAYQRATGHHLRHPALRGR